MTISTRIYALKYPFFPKTVIDWNHLDEGIVSAPTVPSFKDGLRGHDRIVRSLVLYKYFLTYLHTYLITYIYLH